MVMLNLEFEEGERLTMEVDPPVGQCSVCRKTCEGNRLDLDGEVDGRTVHVRVCRFCLAEHAPSLLAAIES